MVDLNALLALKNRLDQEPVLTLEKAAEVCAISTKTLRRHIHRFEVRRGRNRHIYVTVRSIMHYLAREQYQPSPHFDLTRSLKP